MPLGLAVPIHSNSQLRINKETIKTELTILAKNPLIAAIAAVLNTVTHQVVWEAVGGVQTLVVAFHQAGQLLAEGAVQDQVREVDVACRQMD